jgi:antitoxin (DNA-binding transcriptional repressor) of toxin-antitoxin stability system
METVTIHKAKTELSRLIEKACRGEEIVIARGKKPLVRLVAIEDKRGERKPGAWKGKTNVGPEFFEPLPPEEMEGLVAIPFAVQISPPGVNPRPISLLR